MQLQIGVRHAGDVLLDDVVVAVFHLTELVVFVFSPEADLLAAGAMVDEAERLCLTLEVPLDPVDLAVHLVVEFAVVQGIQGLVDALELILLLLFGQLFVVRSLFWGEVCDSELGEGLLLFLSCPLGRSLQQLFLRVVGQTRTR